MSHTPSKKTLFLTMGVIAFALLFIFSKRTPSYLTIAPQAGMMGRADSDGGFAMGAPAVDMMQRDVMTEKSISPVPPIGGESVDVNATDRKRTLQGDLSLQVKDVKQTVQAVEQKTNEVGGFIVSSSLNNPGEASSGYMSVRVPSDQSQAFLDFARGQAVKVVSENFYGQDVTDQYTDLEAQRALLTETKTRFEEIYRGANTTKDILEVQQQILNIQRQLDAITGQLKYLESVSDSVLISLHMSTDDLSLPYAPDDAWRPRVVFKLAVRSLVTHLRGTANLAIWTVVYSPLIAIVGIGGWVGYRVMKKKSK